MKRIISVSLIFLLTLSLFSCGKSNLPLYEGHDSSPYMTALARGEYYLEMSMLYGGAIVSNTLAVKNGNFESISEIQNIYTETGAPGEKRRSHSLRIGEATYFLDDENKVYFLTRAVGDNGLSAGIDYATAVYTASGSDTLLTGSTFPYDEYTVQGTDGAVYTLRLYVSGDALCAIVLSNGEDSYEQDIAVFSEKIPRGMLSLPRDYTEVSEDTYFKQYYGA